jgi:hypothetical protein
LTKEKISLFKAKDKEARANKSASLMSNKFAQTLSQTSSCVKMQASNN